MTWRQALAYLQNLVRTPPERFGYQRTRWTLAMILESCREWFAVTTLAGCWKVLRRMRISWRKGQAHVHSPDPNYTEKRQRIVNLYTECSTSKRTHILYMDEVGYERRPTLAPAYHPMVAGQKDMTIDAGFYQPSALGSYVWLDENRDGIRDPGEPPIEGITVLLFREGDPDPIGTTITDKDGFFLFEDVPPGFYFLRFIAPSGFEFTIPHATDASFLGSDADRKSGETQLIELEEGVRDLDWGAGFIKVSPTADPLAPEPDQTGWDRFWLPAILNN